MRIRIFAVVFLLCTGMVFLPQDMRADFYEDFSGTQIDLTNWTVVEYGSLNASLIGGKLFINGTYDPGETSPNTGGWNQYWLVYNQSFTGFVDISVYDNIVNMTAGEVAVGLGVIVDPGVVYDNVTTWVQYYFNGLSAIGRFGKWDNMTSTTLMLDNTDITIGEACHHRMIVYDNKSVQLLIDGVTKGWSNISGYASYYPLVTVGMKYAGTYLEAEFDDFLVVTDAVPDVVLTATSTNLDVGELVGFDGSQSSYTVGSIEAYNFDFGDGNSSGWIGDSFATYSYAGEGSCDARLKVRADNGRESEWATLTMCVDCAVPTIQYTLRPSQVDTYEPVWFTANGSSDADGTIIGYLFDFGDGSTSGWIMDPYTSHSYEHDGMYDTAVKLLDDDGHQTDWSASITVRVDNQPPVAVLSVDTHVDVGESLLVDGSLSYDPDGEVVEYDIRIWDEVHYSSDVIGYFVHRFGKAGVYHITLTVSDDDGEVSEAAEARIVVYEKEPEDHSLSWAIIVLLLIILILAVIVLMLQWLLLRRRKPPGGPPWAGPQ